ncbi:ABC transporter permease [Deinococcus fonticola]|uniref:ABC transporter permease n=1 Tax=Deinococcus fonticola TaxID=2528713 RepID=UPI001074FACF|nr:ABC transporter permease [Deinococcus fonticola]
MTTPTLSLPAPTSTRRTPLLPALGQLVRAELRRMFRNPMFALGTIGFPILFFGLFGLPNIREVTASGVNVGQLILVNFGAYSLLSLAMFSFGSAVAAERTGGWLRLLRASPLPTLLYFTAKVVAALLFSAMALGALYAFAHFAGGVTLPLGLALTVLVKLLLGMIALIAMGLAVGFLANPQAAQITAQIVAVIMSFASGLFVPLEELPRFVQQLAPFLPAYHLSQLVGGTLLPGHASQAAHWLALAAFTLVFGALAVWGFRKDESREQ